MKKTEYGADEINQLLNIVRNYDNEIGNYEQHYILPDDVYSVKLTNGSIRIYMQELEDKRSLLQDRLKDIAARFSQRK